jgi:hypothetical protein
MGVFKSLTMYVEHHGFTDLCQEIDDLKKNISDENQVKSITQESNEQFDHLVLRMLY